MVVRVMIPMVVRVRKEKQDKDNYGGEGDDTYGGEGDEGEVGPLQEGPLLPGRKYNSSQQDVGNNKH